MDIDRDHTCKEIDNVLYSSYLSGGLYNIYKSIHTNSPITVYFGENKMKYNTSKTGALVYFRLLILKEVLK